MSHWSSSASQALLESRLRIRDWRRYASIVHNYRSSLQRSPSSDAHAARRRNRASASSPSAPPTAFPQARASGTAFSCSKSFQTSASACLHKDAPDQMVRHRHPSSLAVTPRARPSRCPRFLQRPSPCLPITHPTLRFTTRAGGHSTR